MESKVESKVERTPADVRRQLMADAPDGSLVVDKIRRTRVGSEHGPFGEVLPDDCVDRERDAGFGHWDVVQPECIECACATTCMVRTLRLEPRDVILIEESRRSPRSAGERTSKDVPRGAETKRTSVSTNPFLGCPDEARLVWKAIVKLVGLKMAVDEEMTIRAETLAMFARRYMGGSVLQHEAVDAVLDVLEGEDGPRGWKVDYVSRALWTEDVKVSTSGDSRAIVLVPRRIYHLYLGYEEGRSREDVLEALYGSRRRRRTSNG